MSMALQKMLRAFKEAQYKALLQIESATAERTIPPDVANALDAHPQ